MKEGWHNDQHYILYESKEECEIATKDYEIAQSLSDQYIVGLLGWDYFILCSLTSEYTTVPTVPLIPKEQQPFQFPSGPMTLEADPRYENKIKWYIKPIIFGGSPEDQTNIQWVTHEQHRDLVKYWNNLYRNLTNKGR